MRKEIFESIRKEYKLEKEKLERFKKLYFENKEIIDEYDDLLEYFSELFSDFEDEVRTPEDAEEYFSILGVVIDGLRRADYNTRQPCNIYLYNGTFKTNSYYVDENENKIYNCSDEIKCSYNEKDATFRKYDSLDCFRTLIKGIENDELEANEYIVKRYGSAKEFEEKNVILIPDEIDNMEDTEEIINGIIEKYFALAFDVGQEAAQEKIKTLYKRKKIYEQ